MIGVSDTANGGPAIGGNPADFSAGHGNLGPIGFACHQRGVGAGTAAQGSALTGAHDPTSSHHALLEAFAPRAVLSRALRASLGAGYRGHELGDSWLIER